VISISYFLPSSTQNENGSDFATTTDNTGKIHVAQSNNFSAFPNKKTGSATANDSQPQPTAIEKHSNAAAASTATTITTSNNRSRPHLWIDAITYAEGIAGWKISLLELLYFAQKIGGATLVEPCMSSGRLRSCGSDGYKTRGVPVSEIFDLDEYMKPPYSSDDTSSKYPVMVSYDDYQRILGSTTTTFGMVKVCMLNDIRYPSFNSRCTNDTSWILKMKQNNIQRMMDKSNQEHFVLHMEDYWRGSVYELGWQFEMYILDDDEERFEKGMEIPDQEVFEEKTIPFHSKHVQLVDELLQRANITNNNFSVIHWRAEKEGMDFMQCARAVNAVKDIMLRRMMSNNTNNTAQKEEEASQHKFVLMSSLNENEDMMWSGARHTIVNSTKSSHIALQYLLRDNGFIKIDGLLEAHSTKVHNDDPGMLAIYDLIIATKAINFATCARGGEAGCNDVSRRLCDACNHIGKFGRLATLLRKQDAYHSLASSWECWPSDDEKNMDDLTS